MDKGLKNFARNFTLNSIAVKLSSPGGWLSTSNLLIAASILFAAKMLTCAPGFLGVAVIGLATVLAWSQFKNLRGRWRWAARFLTVIITSSLTAVWLATNVVEPAHAQFLYQAEQFFLTKILPGVSGTGQAGGTSVISIIFNVMRALYILYLAVALIGVVNAVRQDEDWQTAARTPLLIFVCITAADVP
jgi:hypothetical protein